MGLSQRNYRIFYNLVAGISFLAVLWLSLKHPSSYLFTRAGWTQTLGLILAVWGVWIINLSFRYYDFRSFIGFRAEPEGRLQKSGLMKIVRHPIYLGTLMIMFGFFFYSPTQTAIIIAGVTFIYVFIGIGLEERKLIEEFGDEYRDYQKEVPMLIPYIKF